MKIKSIIPAIVCMSIFTLTQAQSKSTPLKNGKKIIVAIENDTKTVVDILPAEALPDKTTAAKIYPGSTFFAGMLYGESSRSVRPHEYSDIKKRQFASNGSKTGSRSVRPHEYSDIEKRTFLTIKSTKNFSVVPQKDAIMAFDLSQTYIPGSKFLFRDYVVEKPDYVSGDTFLVMFDEKKKMVVLKSK